MYKTLIRLLEADFDQPTDDLPPAPPVDGDELPSLDAVDGDDVHDDKTQERYTSLSSTQRAVLAAIAAFKDAPLKMEALARRSEKVNGALSKLYTMDLIDNSSLPAHLTDQGEEACQAFGFTDDMGELTELGKKQVVVTFF